MWCREIVGADIDIYYAAGERRVSWTDTNAGSRFNEDRQAVHADGEIDRQTDRQIQKRTQTNVHTHTYFGFGI